MESCCTCLTSAPHRKETAPDKTISALGTLIRPDKRKSSREHTEQTRIHATYTSLGQTPEACFFIPAEKSESPESGNRRRCTVSILRLSDFPTPLLNHHILADRPLHAVVVVAGDEPSPTVSSSGCLDIDHSTTQTAEHRVPIPHAVLQLGQGADSPVHIGKIWSKVLPTMDDAGNRTSDAARTALPNAGDFRFPYFDCRFGCVYGAPVI